MAVSASPASVFSVRPRGAAFAPSLRSHHVARDAPPCATHGLLPPQLAAASSGARPRAPSPPKTHSARAARPAHQSLAPDPPATKYVFVWFSSFSCVPIQCAISWCIWPVSAQPAILLDHILVTG